MERDTSGRIAQIDDPDLEARLLRLFNVIGPLGLMALSDVAVPTILLGSTQPLEQKVIQPHFTSAQVHTEGVQQGAGANTNHVNTGALSAGIYDVILQVDLTDGTAAVPFNILHRNATDSGNVSQWAVLSQKDAGGTVYRFGYELAENERFRVQNANSLAGPDRSNAVMFMALRT